MPAKPIADRNQSDVHPLPTARHERLPEQLAERLARLINRESVALSELAHQEVEMRSLVAASDWPGLESATSGLTTRAGTIAEIEAERARVYAALCRACAVETDQTSFMELVARLPESSRRTLSDAHRALRISVIRVQGAFGRVTALAGGMSRTVRQFLDALLPGGSSYDQAGMRQSHDRPAILVNRTL